MRYSLPVAYFLWLISGLGALGFHRFYMGKVGTGVLWALTGGLGMIGAFYDLVTMGRQVEKANFEVAYRANYLSQGAGFKVESPPARESLELVILRIAKRNQGIVTPGEVALEAETSLDEARKVLDRLASQGAAEMRVRSSGVVAYVFPEFSGPRDDFVV